MIVVLVCLLILFLGAMGMDPTPIDWSAMLGFYGSLAAFFLVWALWSYAMGALAERSDRQLGRRSDG